MLAVGAVLLGLGSLFLTSGYGGQAAGGQEGILKAAEALEKKDLEGARKQAEAVGKSMEVDEIMQTLALRRQKGLGIGPKPGAITPDGIEAKIIALGKKPLTPKEAEAQSKDLARAAYVTAAVAEATRDKCPVQEKQGDKDPKEWKAWMEDMHKGALALAEAAMEKNPKAIKAAATKLQASCNSCHEKFK